MESTGKRFKVGYWRDNWCVVDVFSKNLAPGNGLSRAQVMCQELEDGKIRMNEVGWMNPKDSKAA